MNKLLNSSLIKYHKFGRKRGKKSTRIRCIKHNGMWVRRDFCECTDFTWRHRRKFNSVLTPIKKIQIKNSGRRLK